jgi:threonyl-tRNA synthetase
MNCPHHHLIYGATRPGYHELLRIAEYGRTIAMKPQAACPG